MNPISQNAINELIACGFVPKVIQESSATRRTYYSLGSLSVRIHVDTDSSPGQPRIRIQISHVEWDKDHGQAHFTDELDHFDLSALADIVPTLLRITSIERRAGPIG